MLMFMLQVSFDFPLFDIQYHNYISIEKNNKNQN